MDEPGASPTVVMAGDLGDPWVADLASSIPGKPLVLNCPGDLPDSWPEPARGARILVLHRSFLTAGDAERLARDRRAGLFPRVILCVGPHARYHHVQRWSERVDVILPESTASEVIARYVGEPRPAVAPGSRLTVVSSLYEVGLMLSDTAAAAGYQATRPRGWHDAPPGVLAVWDVPVLEPEWPSELALAAACRPVVALIGFADRSLVRLARARGAVAVLDMPCDPADLAHVLARLDARASASARLRVHRGHGETGPHRPSGVGETDPDAYNPDHPSRTTDRA